MKVVVKTALELKKAFVLEKGGDDVVIPSGKKAPRHWEPKDGKADTKSKRKNKKHRAKQGFDKVSGNKSPQHVAGAGGKPEQLRSDNGKGHLLRDKMECGEDG